MHNYMSLYYRISNTHLKKKKRLRETQSLLREKEIKKDLKLWRTSASILELIIKSLES